MGKNEKKGAKKFARRALELGPLFTLWQDDATGETFEPTMKELTPHAKSIEEYENDHVIERVQRALGMSQYWLRKKLPPLDDLPISMD